VAAVDADAHKELGGRFGIQGYSIHKLVHCCSFFGIVIVQDGAAMQHRMHVHAAGFPTIKLFHVSNGKLVSSDYSGGRSADDIIKGALAEASKVALGRIGAKASGGGGAGRASGGVPGCRGCAPSS
jgi:hypothetical protein